MKIYANCPMSFNRPLKDAYLNRHAIVVESAVPYFKIDSQGDPMGHGVMPRTSLNTICDKNRVFETFLALKLQHYYARSAQEC